MANSSLSLLELDVPALESSLRDFMRSQTVFRDYDWEGSNLSALIRLLAVNTYKNAWYTHMLMSEGFLDSAQTRSSVMSHAKELNYSPRSARSAKARVRISFSGTETVYVIEKGRTMTSVVNNRGLIFSVPETLMVSSSNGSFTVDTDLYEGQYVKESYVFNRTDESQRIFLSNPQVDTRSLSVVVYEDGASEGRSYKLATSLLDVKSDSLVFFLQASELGKYEVIFGDGVIGARPPDGSTVILDYRVTNGVAGNGARIFNRDFGLGEGATNVTVTTLEEAADGAEPESIDSIKYYAPRHFQAQERAITPQDYAIMLKGAFPEIRAVSAYGGEDATPPQYGKVIVAVDVAGVDGIPQSKEQEYRDFLKSRASITIEPVIVRPSYSYLRIRSRVLYNINVSTLSPQTIETLVVQSILDYADENLNDFDSLIRYSRLVSLIDDSHRSIVGNSTELEIYKKVPVESGTVHSFTVDFKTPLLSSESESYTGQRTLRSGFFKTSSDTRYLVDDSRGGVWTATDRGGQRVLIQRVGSVDYATGLVRVAGVKIDQYEGADLKVFARPLDLDVSVSGDVILQVEADEISIAVESVRE